MQLQGFKCIKHGERIEETLEVFFKKDALEIFTKFTGKHLCQSLRPANLFKERPWHRCFPLDFLKYFGAPLFTEHLRRYENFFLLFPFWKNNRHFKAATENCYVRKACLCLGNWGVLDSTQSGHNDKIGCSVKILPFCVGYWRVLDYNLEDKLKAPWQN